jgi:hypothetical protein
MFKLDQIGLKWINLIQNKSYFHIKGFFGHGRAINILGFDFGQLGLWAIWAT